MGPVLLSDRRQGVHRPELLVRAEDPVRCQRRTVHPGLRVGARIRASRPGSARHQLQGVQRDRGHLRFGPARTPGRLLRGSVGQPRLDGGRQRRADPDQRHHRGRTSTTPSTPPGRSATTTSRRTWAAGQVDSIAVHPRLVRAAKEVVQHRLPDREPGFLQHLRHDRTWAEPHAHRSGQQRRRDPPVARTVCADSTIAAQIASTPARSSSPGIWWRAIGTDDGGRHRQQREQDGKPGCGHPPQDQLLDGIRDDGTEHRDADHRQQIAADVSRSPPPSRRPTGNRGWRRRSSRRPATRSRRRWWRLDGRAGCSRPRRRRRAKIAIRPTTALWVQPPCRLTPASATTPAAASTMLSRSRQPCPPIAATATGPEKLDGHRGTERQMVDGDVEADVHRGQHHPEQGRGRDAPSGPRCRHGRRQTSSTTADTAMRHQATAGAEIMLNRPTASAAP